MKAIKSQAFLIAVMTILGIIGGVLRYLHLETGFNSLGLNIENNRYSVFLAALVVAVLAILAIIAVLSKKGTALAADKLRLGTIGWQSIVPISLASLLIIAGTAVKVVVSVKPFSVWGLLNGMLMFASGAVSVSTVRKMSAKNNGQAVNGTAALVPVFMACFALIEYYRDISKNPVPSIYFYNVLSYIALILMVYSCAGYLFSRVSLVRVFISMLAYMFYGAVTLIGQFLYIITNAGASGWIHNEFLDNNIVEILILGYGFFFAVSVLVLYFRPKRVEVLEE
jgi:hypothetical protein